MLLSLEINRLNKFYEPTHHKTAPKVKCCAENRVYVNMGGEIAIATPTGIVNTDVQRLQPLREPVVELKTSKFEKKTESFSGVVAFLKKSIADVEKDAMESQTEEKNSQEQYEEFMAESSESRADKVKEIIGPNDPKRYSNSDTKAELQSGQSSAAAVSKQECDSFVQSSNT